MSISKLKLEQTLKECELHIKRLSSASDKMKEFMPLNADKYINLTENEIEHIDQYLYRFAKLQDAIGHRLFKNALLVLGEEIENKSFIDVFNRLEQLNITEDYDKWLELRIVRNELSHDYEDDPKLNSTVINKIFELKDPLISYFVDVKNYLVTKKL